MAGMLQAQGTIPQLISLEFMHHFPWFSLPAVTYILLVASAYASHSTPAAQMGCAGDKH